MVKMTMHEACWFLKITRQAIYAAVLKKMIVFKKMQNGRIQFQKKDLENYRDNRYKRDRHYSPEQMSVKEAAKYLECTEQRIYYLVRTRRIKHTKPFGMILIERDSIDEAPRRRKKRHGPAQIFCKTG